VTMTPPGAAFPRRSCPNRRRPAPGLHPGGIRLTRTRASCERPRAGGPTRGQWKTFAVPPANGLLFSFGPARCRRTVHRDGARARKSLDRRNVVRRLRPSAAGRHFLAARGSARVTQMGYARERPARSGRAWEGAGRPPPGGRATSVTRLTQLQQLSPDWHQDPDASPSSDLYGSRPSRRLDRRTT
jgi:hypothetical protein